MKQINDKIRGWKNEYQEGKVSRKEILDNWSALDTHTDHSNTYMLRREIALEVSKIIGPQLKCHVPIRLLQAKKGDPRVLKRLKVLK